MSIILCDIDGCLFNNFHRKALIPLDKSTVDNWRPFNKKCIYDVPIMETINLVKYLQSNNSGLLMFLTARDWSIFDETMAQLDTYFGRMSFGLYMRAESDRRTSIEYKKEALGKLAQHFTPNSLIIDDNADIMAMAARHYPVLNRLLLPSFDCCNNTQNTKGNIRWN